MSDEIRDKEMAREVERLNMVQKEDLIPDDVQTAVTSELSPMAKEGLTVKKQMDLLTYTPCPRGCETKAILKNEKICWEGVFFFSLNKIKHMTFTEIVQGNVAGFDKVGCGAPGCTMSEREALQNLDDIPDALPCAEAGCGRLIPTDSANCDVHQEVSMTAMTVMELISMGTDYIRAIMKLTNTKTP